MSELHPAIPRVSCPSCGDTMRLGRIQPDSNGRSEMQFGCDCGFEYRMSARARGEFEPVP